MKRLAAVIALSAALIAPAAHAGGNDTLCTNLADFSGLVATQRDAGLPLLEVKRQINLADMRSDVRQLFLTTATTIYMDQQFAPLNANGVRARVYSNCMAVTGS